MARFNLLQTINIVVSTGIVPVFYHKDPEVAKILLRRRHTCIRVHEPGRFRP